MKLWAMDGEGRMKHCKHILHGHLMLLLNAEYQVSTIRKASQYDWAKHWTQKLTILIVPSHEALIRKISKFTAQKNEIKHKTHDRNCDFSTVDQSTAKTSRVCSCHPLIGKSYKNQTLAYALTMNNKTINLYFDIK